MKKASKYRYLEAFKLSLGRGERIRTFDPLVPNQMRYQAALRPDISILTGKALGISRVSFALQQSAPTDEHARSHVDAAG